MTGYLSYYVLSVLFQFRKRGAFLLGSLLLLESIRYMDSHMYDLYNISPLRATQCTQCCYGLPNALHHTVLLRVTQCITSHSVATGVLVAVHNVVVKFEQ